MPDWLDPSAIFWGMGLALAISILGGVMIGGVFAALDETEDPDDTPEELDFNRHPAIWGWIMGVTVLASLASGALTGWLAEAGPVRNAAVLAAATVVLHVLMRDREAPAWLNRASAGVMPACILGAAYLAS